MKKKLVITLCLMMSLSLLLCSCQGGGKNTNQSQGSVITTTQDTATNVTEPTEDSTDPTKDSAEPTKDSTEPTKDSSEPTKDSSEPTKDSTDTTTKAPSTTTTKKPTTTQAHKHSYTSKTTKQATCAATGVKTFTCSGCGHQYTESIPKTNHNWSSWSITKLFSPSQVGSEKRTCSGCNKAETRQLAPEGEYYANVGSYNNGVNNKVSLQPRYVFWDNGNLYIDYYIINHTGRTQTVTGINSLTLYYVDVATQKKTVIAELSNLKLGSPVTLANKQYKADEVIIVGTNDIVTFNCPLSTLAWEIDFQIS